MAFNISSLPQYVDQTSKTLLVDTVFGNQTATILKDAGSVTLGVKGQYALQLLSTDVTLQNGGVCGRSATGNANFSQAILTVHPIKDEQNLCNKPLENSWMVQYLTKGQTYTEALFANEIMSARAAKIAQESEKLIWQGDTVAQSGNTTLGRFDGFIKQIGAGAYINLSGATGSTTLAKLQNGFLGMPTKITSQSDAVIFVGTDVYNEVVLNLANLNIYKPTEDKTLYGTTGKLVPVDGLIGTRKVYFGRLRSYQLGTDLLGEEDKATMQYSIETQNIYMDFHFALGVVPVYVNEIGVATV
ncbi:hypothetical protein [Mucilaginibacter sp.]|uniref:hypothetical protein n=1 Tax=Mucilaginibacter sp. TaxID=1882438 RepID=UPI003D0FA8B7